MGSVISLAFHLVSISLIYSDLLFLKKVLETIDKKTIKKIQPTNISSLNLAESKMLIPGGFNLLILSSICDDVTNTQSLDLPLILCSRYLRVV